MKSIPEHELKAETVHRMLAERLQSHLSLKTEGYRCTTEQVLNVLLKAAAESSSLEAACNDHPDGMDANTVREQLNGRLEVTQLRHQEAEMNQALASALAVAMPGGGLEVAIDTRDEPFYGKTPELLTYTSKCKAKAGTPASSGSPAPNAGTDLRFAGGRPAQCGAPLAATTGHTRFPRHRTVSGLSLLF